MISIRQTLRNISPWHREVLPFDQATEEDLFYCYRLLLQREPDKEGWENFKRQIHIAQFPIAALVDTFLNSGEFKTLQEQAATTVLVELEDFNIYIRRNDFFVGAGIEKYRTYEPHVCFQLNKILNEGDVFIDIGANIGFFTLLAASKVGPEGHVHAFEPLQENCDSISKSVKENSFNNVTIYPNAVAETGKTFLLEVSGLSSNARIQELNNSFSEANTQNRQIEAVTLDEALEGRERINVIKMDIEGAEPRAWQGMANTIHQFHPVVILEFSPDLIRTTSHVEPTDFLQEISKRGYDLFVIDNKDGQTTKPQANEEILRWWKGSGLSHIDLMAIPKG